MGVSWKLKVETIDFKDLGSWVLVYMVHITCQQDPEPSAPPPTSPSKCK